MIEYLVLIGVIWLLGKIFEKKTPERPSPPVQPTLTTEQIAKELEDKAKFKSASEEWLREVVAFTSKAGWIPKSAAWWFLKKNPAPKSSGGSWAQAVGDASPGATLKKYFDKHNANHLANQRIARKAFFDTVEKNPLTNEQIHACICMDDAVMVVAAAGSGKTSTMVAKTGYAIHEGLAKPEQVLLLAFNRATADELGERISEQLRSVPDIKKVRSNTFHAFGIEVIGKATGKKPSLAPWVEMAGADIREISDIIKTLSERDAKFKREWNVFRTIYARDVGKRGQQHQPDAFREGKKGFLTADGKIVKSKEERTIADWLFYHGVDYVYEVKYEHDTADEEHRQYFPDFYYPQISLYHEHFALDGEGRAPKEFKNYLEGVEWKRDLHARMGTKLFETTSHTLFNREGLDDLEAALFEGGLEPMFDEKRVAVGLQPVPESDLARTFRVFQQHVKNNGLTHTDLHEALEKQVQDGFEIRLRMFLWLYEHIAGEWERRLRDGGFIDFEDMLIEAAKHVESKRFKSPYTVILADEFQDSSRARIRLLKALAANPDEQTHLCVVGDDWQGINRFAGSDISVMTEFEKTFAHSTRLTLNTTFRCPQHLCDVSSKFIQANPAQIKKSVATTNPLTKTPLLAYAFEDEHAMTEELFKQLELMSQLVQKGKLAPMKGKLVSVMLLGRYNKDVPRDLGVWKSRFANTLKLDFKTAHASKGLEAEYVFVLNVVQGTMGFPSQIQDDPALQLAMPTPDPFTFAEERRLFYVAMTRARKQVRFYTITGQPSQFLLELSKNKHLEITTIDGQAVEACPKCGKGVMEAKSSSRGDFQGCSAYPACEYTRKPAADEALRPRKRSDRITQPVKPGSPCPICRQGFIEQKMGRNGAFLGCSRYRQGCKATANIDPVPAKTAKH